MSHKRIRICGGTIVGLLTANRSNGNKELIYYCAVTATATTTTIVHICMCNYIYAIYF
jgi:hypothetical protein